LGLHWRRPTLQGPASMAHLVTGPEPEPRQQIEPLHAGHLVGPQRSAQRFAGTDAQAPRRDCAMPRGSPKAMGRPPSRSTAPANMRIALLNDRPSLEVRRSIVSNCCRVRLSRARSTLHPLPADQRQVVGMGEQPFDLRRRQSSAVEGDFHREVQERIDGQFRVLYDCAGMGADVIRLNSRAAEWHGAHRGSHGRPYWQGHEPRSY
jgi:hypothetical protein